MADTRQELYGFYQRTYIPTAEDASRWLVTATGRLLVEAQAEGRELRASDAAEVAIQRMFSRINLREQDAGRPQLDRQGMDPDTLWQALTALME